MLRNVKQRSNVELRGLKQEKKKNEEGGKKQRIQTLKVARLLPRIPSRLKGRHDFELNWRGSVRRERGGKTRRHFEKRGELYQSYSACQPKS